MYVIINIVRQSLLNFYVCQLLGLRFIRRTALRSHHTPYSYTRILARTSTYVKRTDLRVPTAIREQTTRT